MRINEVVGKVDPKPYDAFAAGRKAGAKMLSPDQWFGDDPKDADPNLMQNPWGFMQGKDAIDMVLQGITLYPADVNNIKTVARQVQGGHFKLPANVNKEVLMTALGRAAAGDVLTPEQTATLKLFHKNFR